MAHILEHRVSLTALSALLLVLALPGWASQVLVYAQNPDFNVPYASQNDTSGFGVNFTSYDNIALSSRTTLTSVESIGGYYSPQRTGSTGP